jgi:hypothetical protein
MKTSLINYRQSILEGALALIWRQWAQLGVPGHVAGPARGISGIIDPEALLLVTSELGRFDARLFDEAINWTRQYGKLVNIQRLKSLQQAHALGNQRVLSAIAATVLKNSRLAKWQAIESLAEPQSGSAPLFLNQDGSAAPVFGRADPYFGKFGYFRGMQKARENALAPKVERPELLLIKLRSLFGVNARAEIMAVLLSLQHAHPSALARRIGYLPRSVQDILNEMALSGHVVTTRPRGTREKYFSLLPGDWQFLITWPESKFPRWVDWALLFSLLQEVTMMLFSEELKNASMLMAALRLRESFERHLPALSEAGLAGYFPGALRESGAEFLRVFSEELMSIGTQV